LLLSRAPWLERVGILALIVVAVAATKRVVHESIAGGGMGMLLYIYAIPILSLALVTAAAIARRASDGRRRATLVAVILFACGLFTLVRTGGVTGEGDSDLHWRWSETPEERLLRLSTGEPGTGSGSRGGRIQRRVVRLPRSAARRRPARGVRIATDWAASPPVELWRRPIGPAGSSFAVHGDPRLPRQEQRGEEELVSCYRTVDRRAGVAAPRRGAFWESNAGAGPRATPDARRESRLCAGRDRDRERARRR
jgi:outer membrane protein assembly factor BamB